MIKSMGVRMENDLIIRKAWFPIASYEKCGEVESFYFLGIEIYTRCGSVKKYFGVVTITRLEE